MSGGRFEVIDLMTPCAMKVENYQSTRRGAAKKKKNQKKTEVIVDSDPVMTGRSEHRLHGAVEWGC